MEVVSMNDEPNNALTMTLADGVAYNMGDGLVAIDQIDSMTQLTQRTVLPKADLKALLAWIS